MTKHLSCIICGDVQGVSFRDFTRSTARDLHLVGTVRNCADGTVEVVAEGEEEALREFLHALKEKHPFARVERIDVAWDTAAGAFSDFRILHS